MDDARQIRIRSASAQDADEIWRIRTLAIQAIANSFYHEHVVVLWSAAPGPQAFGSIIVNLAAVVAEIDG